MIKKGITKEQQRCLLNDSYKTNKNRPMEIKEVKSDDDAFTELCKPLMKYLAENHHPHTKIIIESNTAELLEGVKTTGIINDFIQD